MSVPSSDSAPHWTRIAYLINQYPQTSHTFIRREVAELEARGFSVTRISIREADGPLVEPKDVAEKDRTRVILNAGAASIALAIARTALGHPLRTARSMFLAMRVGFRSQRGILIHLIYWGEACRLREWLDDEGVSHLHAHFGTNSTTVAMLCHELGGPSFSFTCHGPEEFDSPMQLALGEKIRRAAFVVAISEFGRSQLYRWSRLADWQKIHIVRCGIDRSFTDGSSSIPSNISSDETPSLVSIGRLVPQKGQGLLIEAASRLRQEGMKFSLTFLGDGQMRPMLEELVRVHHLEDTVRFAGWADTATIRMHLLASKALVMASFAEGLPVVLMEALALGRPVIATRVAGIPELVEAGACGWLVTPGSVDELATAMRCAVTASEESLARMGAEGAVRIRERHNSSIEAGKLANLFAYAGRDDAAFD